MNNDLNSQRVLKNTIALYIRMAIVTLVSLYTVRVILNALGIEDHGLYGVVGGFVSMFGFFSGSLTNASQRFFAIALGEKNQEKLKICFSTYVVLFLSFGLIIFILSETIGLWYFFNIMVIPPGRERASFIVYEMSIISFLAGIISSPHIAMMVAQEDLRVYAYISIIESILRIVISYMVSVCSGDRLILYSILLMVSSIIVNFSYIFYCKLKYRSLKFSLNKNKKDYLEILSYMSWNLIGATATTFKTQGINMVINLFFSTTVNSARSISVQISNYVQMFSQNFMKAINPYIIKTYANENIEKRGTFKTDIIITISSKLSFYLIFIVAVPIIKNIKYILEIWLVSVPQYTEQFVIITLIDVLIAMITDPVGTGVIANGKVRNYQLSVGVISLLNVPLSYFSLKFNENVFAPFIIGVIISFVMGIARLINYHSLEKSFSIMQYSRSVFLPIVLVTILTSGIIYLFPTANSFFQLVILTILNIIVILGIVFLFGLNRNEKNILLSYLKKIMHFREKNNGNRRK